MQSPFHLLTKVSITRQIMESQYKKRANKLTDRIHPYISKHEKILDVGCGTGFVSKILMEKTSAKITLLDVRKNPLCTHTPVTLYDGKKIPFPDNSFDSAFLIAVLHHCPKPLEVLNEAIRVTSNRLIIMEDLFTTRIEKWLTLVEDSIVNWEFRGHPHSNRREKEWLALFKEKNLSVVNLDKFRLVCAGFPFQLGIFVLEKNKKKTASKPTEKSPATKLS